MLRLFFRIFLICLSALVIISLMTTLWRDNQINQQGRSLSSQHQSLAQEIYNEQGLQGLKDWLNASNQHSPFRIRLDRDSPAHSNDKEHNDSHNEVSMIGSKIRDWLSFKPHIKNNFVIKTLEHGEITLWVEPRRPPRFHTPPPRPDGPIWPILATMIMISLLVALYILKPIKRLHQDIKLWHEKSFVGGIDTSIAKRKDSLGTLGKELNNLSTNVYELLEQQKQLLRDVSHEFRSPMARIKVATALLKHPKSQNKDKLAERIDQEIDSLDYLVEELLTLQRWQRPDNPVQKEAIFLEQMIIQLLERLRFEADQRSITLNFVHHREANMNKATLLGSRKPLERALENIVRNGIRFSPDKGTLNIHLEYQQSQPKKWYIRVSDQGPGVADKAALEKLFDPFFRLDNARTPGEGSYGVGLAIAKEGIKINRGKVYANNRKQEQIIIGLEVVIELPATAP